MSHSGTLVCRGIVSHSGTQRRNILVRREVLSHSGTLLCREVLSNFDTLLYREVMSHSGSLVPRPSHYTHLLYVRPLNPLTSMSRGSKVARIRIAGRAWGRGYLWHVI